jgi:hypothetical protein
MEFKKYQMAMHYRLKPRQLDTLVIDRERAPFDDNVYGLGPGPIRRNIMGLPENDFYTTPMINPADLPEMKQQSEIMGLKQGGNVRQVFGLGTDPVLQKEVKEGVAKNLTIDKIAEKIQKSRATVKRILKVLKINLKPDSNIIKQKIENSYKDFVEKNNKAPSREELAKALKVDAKTIDRNIGDLELIDGRAAGSAVGREVAQKKAIAKEVKVPTSYKYGEDAGIKWPQQQMIDGKLLTQKEIIKSWENDISQRLNYPQGGIEFQEAKKKGKFLTNKQFADKYGTTMADVERIHSYVRKGLNINIPVSLKGATTKRRADSLRATQGTLAINADAKTKNQFHHIFPYAGLEPVKTGDVMILNKYLNGSLGGEYRELNNIAREIVDIDPAEWSTNREATTEKLNKLNEQSKIVSESAKKKLPDNLKGATGYIKYEPVFDENGVVFRYNGEKIGGDPNLSLKKLTDNISTNIKDLSPDKIKQFKTDVRIESRKKILSTDAYGAIGCPNSYMAGGRVKFNKGSECVRKGMKAVESGELNKAQLTAYQNVLQRSGKLTALENRLINTAKKAGSATGKVFDAIFSVGRGTAGLVGGVFLETGLGMDKLDRGDIRGFFRDSILGIIPGTFDSRREELLNIAQSEEEIVALTNLYDYQDKYNQAVELENKIIDATNNPLEGLIEGAEPFDFIAAQKKLAEIDSELAEGYPRVQNEQVQNLVDTVTNRLTEAKGKKMDGLYGKIIGNTMYKNDKEKILKEQRNETYGISPEKKEGFYGFTPEVISPDDQFNLSPRASLQEGGLPVDDRISNLLNSLPGLMIADFVPISEKIELKRLFDQFNDRYMRKAEGGRIKFNKGSDKNNMSRRMFGKLLLGLAALPIVGRYLKLAKPAVKATEIVVNSTPGMPNFFQPLVNKVISEGIDVTQKMSTIERQTVHSSKIANHDVMVYRQLDTGEIDVYIDGPSTMYEDTVRLFYKPGEVSEEASKTAGKIVKEPDKFIAEEAAPGYEGNPFNYELNSDRSFQTDDYKKLASDLSEVEAAVLKSPVNEIQKRKKLERLNFYQSKEGTQQLLEETNPGVEDIGNSFNQSFGDLIDE